MNARSLGATLRELRHRAGLSLVAVEWKTGLKPVRVASWERGDRQPSVGVDLDLLLAAYDAHLVVLRPGEKVVSSLPDGTQRLEWVVVYGGSLRLTRVCESEGEARLHAANIPDSTVGYRVVKTSGVVEAGEPSGGVS